MSIGAKKLTSKEKIDRNTDNLNRNIKRKPAIYNKPHFLKGEDDF